MMPDLWGPPSAAEISAAENENARLSKRVKELEAQNAELLTKVEQLQAERDAAIRDLECNWKCASCKNFAKPITKCPQFHECGLAYIHWQWRGVQKEE